MLFGFRLRLFTLADEVGVRAACRQMGVHHSTFYRWKAKVDRWGLEALRMRERRRPRMPNEIGPHLEGRVIAFSLGHPGFGPRRIAAELAREKWGGVRISEHGVWRVLCRVGLNTRSKRLALIARHADPYERKPDQAPPERHIEAELPGEKVQLDCFYVGRLSGTKGTVWQYTAASGLPGFAWAELHATERNPRARFTKELLHRVARAQGGRLAIAGSDHRQRLGVSLEGVRRGRRVRRARQRRIKAGRPNSDASSASFFILEECWRPSFARSLAPKTTALARDLEEYLRYFNFDRAHTGHLTKGRVPGDIVFGARRRGP